MVEDGRDVGTAKSGDGKAPAAAAQGSQPAKDDTVLQGAEELVRVAASTAAKAAASPAADPYVPVAFALGWQMAELYRPDHRVTRARASRQDLPGLGALTRAQWDQLGLNQVAAGLHRLRPVIDTAGLAPRGTEDLRAVLDDAAEDAEARQAAIKGFHTDVLTLLTAADFRVGKAYGLGRALADTCRTPTDVETAKQELNHHRIEKLRAWIDDLSTALPPHAGQSVSASLRCWSEWIETDGATKVAPRELVAKLRDQGRLWRAVLSGEKSPTAVLTPESYVQAATRLVRRVGQLSRRFLWHFLPVVLLVVALLAGSVLLILLDKGAASRAAGLAGIVTGLGISWKGVGGSLGAAIGKAEQPLWCAALDESITSAITIVPGTRKAAFRDQAVDAGPTPESGIESPR